MRCRSLAIVVAALVWMVGCEKPAVEPAAPTTVAQPATAPAAPAAAADPAEPDETYAALKDEDWCPTAHDDIVKIVEAMKATMKRAGNEPDDDYSPPARERFLELCTSLPVGMRKCLVVGYAARHREACQTELDGLDESQKAAYGELMGK